MNNEEREIDLLALFMALLHRWWIIVLAGAICGAAGLCFAKFAIDPTYESTTSVYVVSKQGEGNLTYSDLQLGTQLTKDYVVLTKSRPVMERVIADLGLNMTVDQLKGCLSVTTASDTRIMYITATHTDPVRAQLIADKTRDHASKHIIDVMKVEEVNVAEYANYPEKKAGPSVTKWTMMGGLLGAFAAAAVLAVLFLMNDKIKTPEDVETYLQVSTLGSIPYCDVLEKQMKADFKSKGKRKSKHKNTNKNTNKGKRGRR